jgi:manganese/iron transport system substrate-binding protein
MSARFRGALFAWLVGFAAASGEATFAQDRPLLVCSTTQVADFARQLVGDRWEVRSVLGSGQDPHTYEVKNDDAALVGRAKLCAENGWNLEGGDWMKRLAENAHKPLVTCVDGVPPILLDHHGQRVHDPHAWFDPTNAWQYVKNLRDAMAKLDPDHKDEYFRRAEAYQFQLVALDGWVRRQVGLIPAERRVLVTHHDAFGYFCQRYGLIPHSPQGWTTGELTDVNMEQRQAVVNSIRELQVKAIFVETTLNRQLLQRIAEDAGVTIGGELYSDAMGPPGSAGETYIGMIRENVITIVEALQ